MLTPSTRRNAGEFPIPVVAGFDPDRFANLVVERFINVSAHPSGELFICNYSARTQYERMWTPETKACRGLIVAPDGAVIARPFEKFHNLGELDPADVPVEPFEVFDKLDGSLGIAFMGPDGPQVATRGSFASDQAVWATSLWRDRYKDVLLDPNVTLLFEIIAPFNRIVVDYAGLEDIVLLAAIDNKTGLDVPLPASWPGPRVRRLDSTGSLEEVAAMVESSAEENAEGFVLLFQSGLRVKVKYSEYVRLHRLITGVSTKTVWESLRDGTPLDEMIERVPDEFFRFVRETATDLRAQYGAIESDARDSLRECGSRKETAEYFKTQRYPGIMFAMLDGKDYEPMIWKMLRPKYELPFRDAAEDI